MEKRRLHAGPQTLGKSIFCNRDLKVRGVTKEERKLGNFVRWSNTELFEGKAEKL